MADLSEERWLLDEWRLCNDDLGFCEPISEEVGVQPKMEAKKAKLIQGMQIDAKFEGGRRWYPGSIKSVNSDGSFDVIYDDGDYEEGVPLASVRPRPGAWKGGTPTWQRKGGMPAEQSPQKDVALLDSVKHCPVCLVDFGPHSDISPSSFGCGHVCCTSCVGRICHFASQGGVVTTRRGTTITCPLCRGRERWKARSSSSCYIHQVI